MFVCLSVEKEILDIPRQTSGLGSVLVVGASECTSCCRPAARSLTDIIRYTIEIEYYGDTTPCEIYFTLDRVLVL